jgi:hypothetical protein
MTECTALLDLLRAPATAKVLAALPGSRIVGGAVRDALAGLPVADVDVGAPFPPEQIMARLRSAGCKVSETGLSHGTVTAVCNHHPIEVTALRRDVLTDGRHAKVAWSTDWSEDAARRDFTINAMSLGADGVLHDYFRGRDDLARGLSAIPRRAWPRIICGCCASFASRRATARARRMKLLCTEYAPPFPVLRGFPLNAFGWNSSAS